ncbi:MAG: apolipoprotein N-acyltransferase [Bacteroidales bacterium]|jgi:apolipoprotein N-acyltransferase|nr:apolipoprotein N-acyltransferase [Bacteroidales bacterium]
MKRSLHKVFVVIILPILTGLLLGVSALPSSAWYLGFIAFIPLLFASDDVLSYKRSFFTFVLQLLIALVVFFLWGYYWVLQTANLGFLIAFVIILPFLLLIPFYILFKKKGNKYAALYFIAAWLTVELIQSYFQLGSPFYNLGNNLGANPKIIQWYEFTGASGGTLWILLVNFLIYSFIKMLRSDRKQWMQRSAALLAVLIIPVIISTIIYNNYKEKGTASEVLVIHPSTDNRDVKYRVNIYELMDIYLDIMLPEITENTEYVVLPETAITNAGWVKDFNRNLVFNYFYKHTDSFPDLKLVTGAISYEEIPNVKKIKNYKKIPGIRYSENYKTWYYTYNAALQLERKRAVQMRVKEGLVPFQEYAPFPGIIPRLSPVGIDFQFSSRDKNRDVFIASNNRKVAAIICYEVVYNKIFYPAVRNGAQAFFVLLNEGWYDSKKVPRQFLQHSAIRAIETRRSIAHASNMGISAFINQRGEVIAKTDSKSAEFLKGEIKMNRKTTFAARTGNYIGIFALLATIGYMVYGFIFIRKSKTINK